MKRFQQLFNKLISENSNSTAGGTLGASSGTSSQFSGVNVWNAGNDVRLPAPVGGVIRRNFPPLMNSKSKKTRKRVKRKKK